MSSSTPPFNTGDVTIEVPSQGGSFQANADGTVFVRITTTTQDVTGCQVTIADLAGGDAHSAFLTTPGGNTFSGNVNAGSLPQSPPSSPNKQVTAFGSVGSGMGGTTTHQESHTFLTWLAGSGSGVLVAAAQQAGSAGTSGKPDPAQLGVQAGGSGGSGGSGGGSGGARALLATLRFCQDEGSVRLWLSPPLDVGGDEPGFWLLSRAAGTAWALRLRHGGTDLVVYDRPATPGSAFPVELERAAPADEPAPRWPARVTVTALE